jgi:hypothetical protein
MMTNVVPDKDPRTGRRVARPNPPEQREQVAVPELRIVDDAIWSEVKLRQEDLRRAAASLTLLPMLSELKRRFIPPTSCSFARFSELDPSL